MYTQRIEKGFNKHMHIYIHSNTTHNSQKVGAAHMSINRWMDKQIGVCVCVYTYIMEYYSAIKRNETFTYAMIWVNLWNIMLNERSQAKKVTYCIIIVIWSTQNRSHKDRMQTGGPQVLRRGQWGKWWVVRNLTLQW